MYTYPIEYQVVQEFCPHTCFNVHTFDLIKKRKTSNYLRLIVKNLQKKTAREEGFKLMILKSPSTESLGFVHLVVLCFSHPGFCKPATTMPLKTRYLVHPWNRQTTKSKTHGKNERLENFIGRREFKMISIHPPKTVFWGLGQQKAFKKQTSFDCIFLDINVYVNKWTYFQKTTFCVDQLVFKQKWCPKQESVLLQYRVIMEISQNYHTLQGFDPLTSGAAR